MTTELNLVKQDDTATPALADQWETEAMAAIEEVQDPAEAERLLGLIKVAEHAIRISKLGRDREHRWGRIRLLGERRYGELLPPKSVGGRPQKETVSATDGFSSSADREARNQARKVAAVPEEKFKNYVQNDPKPSRAGLLRSVEPKKSESMKRERPSDPRRRASWNGKSNPKRQAELLERKRSGEAYTTTLRLQLRISELCGALESLPLKDLNLGEAELALVADIHDDLIALGEWHDRALSAVQAWMVDEHVREKIRKLRDVTGREPAEAETYRKLADRLERKLDARLGA